MFLDEAFIFVSAGSGGNGCISFRREKYIPFGGPSGGDGGNGGNIVLEATASLQTLLDFRYKQHFKAKRGSHGKGKNMHGKDGDDLILPVPLGTVVYDRKTGALLGDLAEPGRRLIAAKGGKGGRGNARFANSVQQAPRFAEKGEQGETLELRLELKLLADVGITGFPNAGKSTLLSRISAARPKIADYPFTTITPQLGVVSHHEKQAVFADIPGLIKGAHSGAGLGIRFLKHIERTRLLVHLVDLAEIDKKDPLKGIEIIENELAAFSEKLSRKPKIFAGNKIDLPEARENVPLVADLLKKKGNDFFPISAATGEGIEQLLNAIFLRLETLPRLETVRETVAADATREEGLKVNREGKVFLVSGKEVERAVAMTDLDNEEAVFHLQKIFSKHGVEPILRKLGIREGDIVRIGDIEFSYHDMSEASRRLRWRRE